jgi:hypothetical protein
VIGVDSNGEVKIPIIEFADHQGRSRRVSLSFSNSRVGDSTEVVYLRENPNRVREVSFGGLWVMPVILIAFGCFAFVFGAGLYGIAAK